MKTRTKKTAGPKASKPESQEISTQSSQSLEPNVDNPPHLFILPKDLSIDSRIVTLPCPATNNPSRYLVCPDNGFFEFTRISPPKQACRSWLLTPEAGLEAAVHLSSNDADVTPTKDREGYVLQQPELFVATPIDPIFMVLPVLLPEQCALVANTDLQTLIEKNARFLSVEDYMDHLCSRAPVLKDIDGIEAQLFSRLDAICDVVQAGDEKMYRPNTVKLYAELVRKARLMVANGLPASMEERFVKQLLVVPELGLKREESTVSIAAEKTTEGEIYESSSTKNDSQDSGYETQDISTSDGSTSSASAASQEITNLLRIRVALDFMQDSYLCPSLKSEMVRLGAQTHSNLGAAETELIDFQPLNIHIAMLNDRKKEAQALRSLSDNISRKRALADDDEAVEKIEAKKRKREEEEAKKKTITRGIKQLEKVDRSGMKKLSSFFSKAPAKK